MNAAKQQAAIAAPEDQGKPGTSEQARAIVQRLEKLASLRTPHESTWRDCFDHSWPVRGSGLQSNTLTAQEIIARRARLVDSTATDSGRVLASSLQAGMTPANARWFGLDVYGATDGDRQWLDAAADQLHQEIHNANFDSESQDCMLDMVAAGWFVLYVDTKPEGGFVFQGWPLAQCYVTSSRADGVVDTIYRAYTLSAQQCINEYGAENVSDKTRKTAETNPDDDVQMIHCIRPRSMYLVGGQSARNMPFESMHVERQSMAVVRTGGYHEFPCVVPRWAKIPGTTYAVGPMADALPDVRMLNDLKRMDYSATELDVAGMWLAVDDGVLNARTIKVGARKVIVAASKDSLTRLDSGRNWQLADTRIAQLQATIRKLLMADQLQPQDGPAMTATEIHARIALIRQQLGPTFGRMQAEYLQGLVTRCFMLAYRAGIFGQAPDTLAGRGFTVEYISPLARSQKLEDVSAIQQTLAFILQVAPLRPEVLDNYDLDAMARKLAEGQGVPQACLRQMQQVMQLRDARRQQQEQAQQQQAQQEMQSMAAHAAFTANAKRSAA